MGSTWTCPKCNGTFTEEGYKSHLPCSGSIVGGSGDVLQKFGSQESVKKGGTGEYDKAE